MSIPSGAAFAVSLLFLAGCCCPKDPCCPGGRPGRIPGHDLGQGDGDVVMPPGGKFVKIKIINTTTTWTVKKQAPAPAAPSTYQFHYDLDNLAPWCDEFTSSTFVTIPADVLPMTPSEFPVGDPYANRWACSNLSQDPADPAYVLKATFTLTRMVGEVEETLVRTTACNVPGVIEATVRVFPGPAPGEADPRLTIQCLQ